MPKIRIKSAPMQQGGVHRGIVVDNGDGTMYTQQQNEDVFGPHTAYVAPQTPQHTIPVPQKKVISYEKLHNQQGNQFYIPKFTNYSYGEAMNAMQNPSLPQKFGDTPVNYAQNFFKEANNRVAPGTNSNQWRPNSQPGYVPLSNMQPRPQIDSSSEYMNGDVDARFTSNYQNGGTKKIRITSIPGSDTFAEGGYANQGATRGYSMQQSGQGYGLNRFWSSPAGYPGSTSQVDPYAKVGKTLPDMETPNQRMYNLGDIHDIENDELQQLMKQGYEFRILE